MAARDHRSDLELELVEAVVERLEQLQVVDGVEVHDLHEVADDRVSRRQKSRGVDHRHWIVDEAEHLVQRERDTLVLVVVARSGLDYEAQHVQPTERELGACRRALDVATCMKPRQARPDLVG